MFFHFLPLELLVLLMESIGYVAMAAIARFLTHWGWDEMDNTSQSWLINDGIHFATYS